MYSAIHKPSFSKIRFIQQSIHRIWQHTAVPPFPLCHHYPGLLVNYIYFKNIFKSMSLFLTADSLRYYEPTAGFF